MYSRNEIPLRRETQTQIQIPSATDSRPIIRFRPSRIISRRRAALAALGDKDALYYFVLNFDSHYPAGVSPDIISTAREAKGSIWPVRRPFSLRRT